MLPCVQSFRGILLHGEPGCGKTLAVRALAGVCSRADAQRHVALFARKAADCLGKFYGDAERTLRLLFEEVHCCSFPPLDVADSCRLSLILQTAEGDACFNSVDVTRDVPCIARCNPPEGMYLAGPENAFRCTTSRQTSNSMC